MPTWPTGCIIISWPEDCFEAAWVAEYDFPQTVNRACTEPCRGSKHRQQPLWPDPLASKPVVEDCCEDASPLVQLLVILGLSEFQPEVELSFLQRVGSGHGPAERMAKAVGGGSRAGLLGLASSRPMRRCPCAGCRPRRRRYGFFYLWVIPLTQKFILPYGRMPGQNGAGMK